MTPIATSCEAVLFSIDTFTSPALISALLSVQFVTFSYSHNLLNFLFIATVFYIGTCCEDNKYFVLK